MLEFEIHRSSIFNSELLETLRGEVAGLLMAPLDVHPFSLPAKGSHPDEQNFIFFFLIYLLYFIYFFFGSLFRHVSVLLPLLSSSSSSSSLPLLSLFYCLCLFLLLFPFDYFYYFQYFQRIAPGKLDLVQSCYEMKQCRPMVLKASSAGCLFFFLSIIITTFLVIYLYIISFLFFRYLPF